MIALNKSIKLFLSCSILFLLFLNKTVAQIPSAMQLLEKSMNYHDPKGKLLNKQISFTLKETRPNGADRSTKLIVDIDQEMFKMIQDRDSLSIESTYEKGYCTFLVNGSKEFSEEITKAYSIDETRLILLKNYYQYLWLLPMKLLDNGTILSEQIMEKDFFGKNALELKVTYDPQIGDDIWYFYFHPTNYALIGYRFYHDESKNDGEYIILEGEVQSGKVKIPKTRKWYMHQDDKYLGSDICTGLKIK